jgi:hypothetical protein
MQRVKAVIDGKVEKQLQDVADMQSGGLDPLGQRQ